MDNGLSQFERLVRAAPRLTQQAFASEDAEHAFETRNLHPSLPSVVRSLFDDGHYSQATFESLKFLDNEVKRFAKSSKMGTDLMMQVFSDQKPVITLTPLQTDSEKSEQKGYQFLFAGAVLALRNPRGHEHAMKDDIDDCLDHLSFVSMLLRRLNRAGYA